MAKDSTTDCKVCHRLWDDSPEFQSGIGSGVHFRTGEIVRWDILS